MPESLAADASCVDAACHAQTTEHRFLHWPALGSECRSCHLQTGDTHVFEIADPPELCASCHPAVSGQNVHDPAEEDCLACHDPHGAPAAGLVPSSDLKALCFTCHDEDLVNQPSVHGPADSGECTECHDPHASLHPNLLRERGNELCAGCHEIAEDLPGARVQHDPAVDDCVNCHDPHAGPHPYMLREKGPALCGECHGDVLEQAKEASVPHLPALEGEACVGCHTPHGGAVEKLLREAPNETCLGCHDRRIESRRGELADIRSKLARATNWHEPIRKNGCPECHAPHGGQRERLLKGTFPTGLYSGFATDRYGLCFSCHPPELVTAKRTRAATRFRQGNRNLHQVHVDRPKRGLSCRACHDVHATIGAHLVRSSLPYGSWRMPIRFDAEPAGGSCLTGCHEQRSYDRGAP